MSDTFFRINVEYMKAVTDEFGTIGIPATWVTSDFDSHDGKAGFILSSVSQRLDKFLVEYLRVNEAACG